LLKNSGKYYNNLFYIGVLVFVCIFLLLLVWCIYLRREELLSVFTPFIVSFVIAYLLSPTVSLIERRGVSRFLAISIIYLIFLIIVYLIVTGFLPPLLDDLQDLSRKLPKYMEGFQNYLNEVQEDYQRFNLPLTIRHIIDENLENLADFMVSKLEKGYSFVLSFFDRLIMLFLVPLLTFYFLYDEKQLKNKIVDLFPRRYKRGFLKIIREIDCQLGAFARGIIIISIIVGVLSYFTFLLLGLDFPLVLGIIAGVTNLIPYLGPFLGAIPAILVASLLSPSVAIKVIIIIIIIQQLESQLMSPLILGRALQFHPLAIILSLLLGGKLFGFIGLLFAVPVALILRILVKHFWINLQDLWYKLEK